MKTPNSSKKRPARHTLIIMKGLLLLLAAGTLVSCGTHSAGTAQSRPPAQKSGHWKMVRSNPPTYFPIGIRADHPTDYWDGMWVSSGDAVGTRYFIPAPKKAYPTAKAIPGKEGFVFNPFTNNPVDVQAVPPGTLWRDPTDPDPTHQFRVP